MGEGPVHAGAMKGLGIYLPELWALDELIEICRRDAIWEFALASSPLIRSEVLSVEIAERGAELRSIRSADGCEWLWQGEPEWWAGRAPLLFPVVGRSPDGTVSISGVKYPMAPHGFARGSDFNVEDARANHVRLTLEAPAETRTSFPFAFRLTAAYRVENNAINVEAAVTNLDRSPMPFQFGYHPGFVWPLPNSAGRPHQLVLGNGGEPACCRVDNDKLLLNATHPSPFVAGKLSPEPGMFDANAMIFPHGAGDSFVFSAEGGASMSMRTKNLPNFAVWQKPGAPYLCLEPWHGTAPFAGTGDHLEDRNGRAKLAPGKTWSLP